MLPYLLRRSGAAIPTLLCLTLVTFALTTAARGDPALLALQQSGLEPTPEIVAEYRAALGLDDPLPLHYLRWLGRVAQGDLGTSFLTRRPVGEMLAERVVPTLALGVAALVFSTALGLGLGMLTALRRGTVLDRAGRSLAVVLGSVPAFWLAIGLIFVFGEQLRVVPVAGYGSWQNFVLPVLALGLGPAASLMRLTRSRMLDVLGEDHVRTARAKGLPEQSVALRHVLRNASLPLVTLTGLRFGHIFAGAIIVESIFAWPGMGSVLIAAISGRDLPVIGGYVLFAGLLIAGANLLVDASSHLIDPRVHVGRGNAGP